MQCEVLQVDKRCCNMVEGAGFGQGCAHEIVLNAGQPFLTHLGSVASILLRQSVEYQLQDGGVTPGGCDTKRMCNVLRGCCAVG